MTACPGQARGLADHDARHVAARIEIPWTDRPSVPVRVVVVHRCEQYGCPLRGVDREEDARNPEEVLRKVLEPRGMLVAPSHANGHLKVPRQNGALSGADLGYGTGWIGSAQMADEREPDGRPYG